MTSPCLTSYISQKSWFYTFIHKVFSTSWHFTHINLGQFSFLTSKRNLCYREYDNSNSTFITTFVPIFPVAFFKCCWNFCYFFPVWVRIRNFIFRILITIFIIQVAVFKELLQITSVRLFCMSDNELVVTMVTCSIIS